MSFSEYITNESQKTASQPRNAAWDIIDDDIYSFYPQNSRERGYSQFFQPYFSQLDRNFLRQISHRALKRRKRSIACS